MVVVVASSLGLEKWVAWTVEAVTTLESGSRLTRDSLRTFAGREPGMLMLLRCEGNKETNLLGPTLSLSELASLSFRLCNEGDWEAGGVGYECKPLVRDNSGTVGSCVGSWDDDNNDGPLCSSPSSFLGEQGIFSFSASEATDNRM